MTAAAITPILPTDAPAAGADPFVSTYKRAPVEFVGGEGVHLIDSAGKRYIDFVSGIAVNALGYGDPGLVAAMHAAALRAVGVINKPFDSDALIDAVAAAMRFQGSDSEGLSR